jgi:hypothetical protein
MQTQSELIMNLVSNRNIIRAHTTQQTRRQVINHCRRLLVVCANAEFPPDARVCAPFDGARNFAVDVLGIHPVNVSRNILASAWCVLKLFQLKSD